MSFEFLEGGNDMSLAKRVRDEDMKRNKKLGFVLSSPIANDANGGNRRVRDSSTIHRRVVPNIIVGLKQNED